MEAETIDNETGAFVFDWPTAACLLRSQARLLLFETNDIIVDCSKGASPPTQTQQRLPIGLAMVGAISAQMECNWNDGSSSTIPTLCHCLLPNLVYVDLFCTLQTRS